MPGIPDHIAADRVFELPLFRRERVYDHPHETLIPAIHRELPAAAYVTNIFPGKNSGWLLRRDADVRSVLRDTEHFSKRGMGNFAASIGETWSVLPTEYDPPEHGAFRGAVNPSFTPQRMAAMVDQLRSRARELIAVFRDRGSCDFRRDFAEQFPIFVVLDLLGLPRERADEFLVWEHQLLSIDDVQVRAAATRSVTDMLRSEIEERIRRPRNDYMTQMLSFEADGRRWTSDEVLGYCFNLYLGGLDTVTSNLGLHFHYLATHPQAQAQLRADPAMIPLAIEELMRAFASVTVFRKCSKPIVIDDAQILPGDFVAISTSVIGRDPDTYEAPNEIRFDRRPVHLALGAGIHKCLGASLARLELRVALEELLVALPEFRVAEGFRVPFFAGNIVKVEDLSLVWDKRAVN